MFKLFASIIARVGYFLFPLRFHHTVANNHHVEARLDLGMKLWVCSVHLTPYVDHISNVYYIVEMESLAKYRQNSEVLLYYF